jgi:glycosyltransferase involved in cell wall biosynthesis
MKIGLISSLYPPYVFGGAEICVKKTAEWLMRKGHEVFVITTSPNRKAFKENIKRVEVYRISPLNLYTIYNHQKQLEILKPIWHGIDIWNPHSYAIVKKILEKEKPDIVHIHNFKGLSLSVFSAVKNLNLPLVFTAHDYSLICPRANLLRKSARICESPSIFCRAYVWVQKYLVNNKPDLVTAPSQFVIDKLKESGLFKNVRTIRLPLGIETNDYKPEKRYETIEILYVGNLSKHKGVHVLIRAFKELKFKNVRLHIVGRGMDEKELRMMAGSDQRIIFHGFVDEEELLQMYREANVTVVPSIWYDNSPTVIYESFTNGTPVLGSRIGGIPELIEEGINGYLFEPGNAYRLKAILEHLKRLEKGAFESAKKYDIRKYIEKLGELFKEVRANYG